jgi:hypothetical protein
MSAAQTGSGAARPVGIATVMRDVVLPGPELEALPTTPESPLVLRVVEIWPHGTERRYDLEWYGLEPGTYDLAAFLRRVDGTPAEGLPALSVEVTSVLPAGLVRPNPLKPSPLPSVGGYTTVLVVLGVAWVLGLVALLAARRRRRALDGPAAAPPQTLADRLRPLVERAIDGTLPKEEHARLELALIALWRRRLALEAADGADALVALRAHADAGPLLRALEEWLHRPARARAANVDVAALLAPYRTLAPEDLR